MADGAITTHLLPDTFKGWFAARGWVPRTHQLACLKAGLQAQSHLLIAPTGGGKTLAGFLPSLLIFMNGVVVMVCIRSTFLP